MTGKLKHDEPCDLRHRTIASIVAHTLVQLVTIGAMCWLVYLDKLSGEWAATAIVAAGGFQLGQLFKGKPPTSLAFAVIEGVRYASNKFA